MSSAKEMRLIHLSALYEQKTKRLDQLGNIRAAPINDEVGDIISAHRSLEQIEHEIDMLERDIQADEEQERDNEIKKSMIELEKLKEQRLAAEAARDAAAIAKAQDNEQFAAILKSLKDDES